ncbi:MAG: ATP synthase subunit I [Desulfuromonadaceae bacterium]|nr:ATP synthase subunit I [Desulfuromonadaceae bacterium]
MSETLVLVLAFSAGAVLGAFFYAGLWWTVRKGLTSSRPALWFMGSMLVRTVVTITGFYLVADGQLLRMGLCLLGFILARPVVTRLTKPAETNSRRGQSCI